ncbi:hypothetical protein FUAX_36370 [Fulvitalea axinellae]|uniref:Uncharacterized protein n=1 Tax=Fulvitalea axinellae TaxID=1182444 RepID=A0AAU9DFB1_9BACT|nr:hypothetical protein FUAX_36370 [Fulvitalea axinellae]
MTLNIPSLGIITAPILDSYQNWHYALYAVGAVAWAMVYLLAIRQGVARKVLLLPIAAICLSISGDLAVSFFIPERHGILPGNSTGVLINRIWLGLDIFVLYALYRWGKSQLIETPRNLYWYIGVTAVLVFLTWMQYIFITTVDLNENLGPMSALITNIIMSFGYIMLSLDPYYKNGSKLIAWSKLVGTLSFSVLLYTVYSDGMFGFFFVLAGGLCAVMDTVYLVRISTKRQPFPEPESEFDRKYLTTRSYIKEKESSSTNRHNFSVSV